MNEPRVAVAVPMKSLAHAKQRLRPAVDDLARQQLAITMLRHVLAAITASGVADVAGVVASDPHVLALAAAASFETIPENGVGYNAAVGQAVAWAQAHGADCLIILPGDLPQLTAADVRELERCGSDKERAVVIAPDQHEIGTNALALRPPNLLVPHFGLDSFAQHCALARAAGVEPILVRSPGLAQDIDWPEDLQHFLAEPAWR